MKLKTDTKRTKWERGNTFTSGDYFSDTKGKIENEYGLTNIQTAPDWMRKPSNLSQLICRKVGLKEDVNRGLEVHQLTKHNGLSRALSEVRIGRTQNLVRGNLIPEIMLVEFFFRLTRRSDHVHQMK